MGNDVLTAGVILAGNHIGTNALGTNAVPNGTGTSGDGSGVGRKARTAWRPAITASTIPAVPGSASAKPTCRLRAWRARWS